MKLGQFAITVLTLVSIAVPALAEEEVLGVVKSLDSRAQVFELTNGMNFQVDNEGIELIHEGDRVKVVYFKDVQGQLVAHSLERIEDTNPLYLRIKP